MKVEEEEHIMEAYEARTRCEKYNDAENKSQTNSIDD